MTPAELLAWRTQADLSQAGLAAILGVDRQTVHRWEHGERSIPPYLQLALNWLAVTYRLALEGITVAQLIGSRKQPTRSHPQA